MKATISFLKKNKALLILPLALLPFMVLIFYILGGGENTKGDKTTATLVKGGQNGVNYQLPAADRSIKIQDKMEAYQQGKSQAVPTHDYNIMGGDTTTGELHQSGQTVDSTGMANTANKSELNADVSNNLLAHIKQKEQQVRKEMEGSKPTVAPFEKGKNFTRSRRQEVFSGTTGYSHHQERQPALQKTGIEELDKVFNENSTLNSQNDSLSQCLKLANQKLKEIEAQKSTSFDVRKEQTQGFDDKTAFNSPVKAEVYETVTVLNGNRVKFRLLEKCQVSGMTIPKNTFFYGTCRIKNERLDIHISQLPFGDSFLPVDLSIYDMDGLQGLYVPDNAARKVAKEVGSSTNTSSLFGVTTNPLVYAGVRAADKTTQSLFKMVRLKKVTIKNNTLVYLLNKE